MQTQAHALQIRGAGLSFGAAGFDRPSNSAPEIGFIRRADGQRDVGECGGRLAEERPILRLVIASRGEASRDRRKIVRTILPDQSSRLNVLRLCCLQVLIRNIDLLFEAVQLRVLINLPPLAAGNRVAGLCRRPVRGQLFVGRRRG